jgi:hypothetical protein
MKVKILLADFSITVYSHGVRALAAYLREKRIHVDALYLPGDGDRFYGTILDQKLEVLRCFSKSYDLIGMSIGTHHFMNRVKQVTDFLKD